MSLGQFIGELGLSELQFALVVIGLLIILFVAILNLKLSRARRNAQMAGLTSHVGEFGKEPVFGSDMDGPKSESERSEPTLSSINLPSIYGPVNEVIDPRIDCVITLRFSQPIIGSEILEEISEWFKLDAKLTAKWMCEGFEVNDENIESWEQLQSHGQYAELQLAIQLASRRGPIGVLELSDFCSRSQILAETLGSQIDMPSVSAMLESAKDLDIIAADSDIQLSINVDFDGKHPFSEIEQLMIKRGFKISRSGNSFEFFSNGELIYFSAGFDLNKPISQITLLLDVPLVSQDQRPFERMLAESLEIAELFHGRLVDDNGINLTEAAVAAIRQHLDLLYSNLEVGGIAAGSSTARRLFS